MGRKIAIIGCGLSGAALALEAISCGCDVVIIERRGRFGPGLAYATDDPALVLNSNPARMSIKRDAPNDFVAWLDEKRQIRPANGPVARSLYGDYLQEHLSSAQKNGAWSSKITLVQGDAVRLDLESAGVKIALSDGRSIAADSAVLAIGHQEPTPPLEASSMTNGFYLNDPWSASDALANRPTARVLLIGTGLTMLDVVLSLVGRGHSGPITSLSRHGLLPLPHSPDRSRGADAISLPKPVSAASRALRQMARAMEGQNKPWQSIMDGAREVAQSYWRSMSLDQQGRFLRHARIWWEVHRHRAPIETISEIGELRDAGRLRVIAGRLVEIEEGEHGAVVRYRPRGRHEEDRIIVDAIVNCTGPCPDLRKSADPLVRRLLATGIASPHATGFGLRADEHGALLGRQGVAAERLFAIGPIVQGEFWEITGAPEIIQAAARLAHRLASTP